MKNILFLLITISFIMVVCTKMNIKFKITFKSNGCREYASVSVEIIKIIKIPKNPTRKNYIFDGWFWVDDVWNEQFTLNSILDQPIRDYIEIKVYAKWVGKELTIEYVLNK